MAYNRSNPNMYSRVFHGLGRRYIMEGGPDDTGCEVGIYPWEETLEFGHSFPLPEGNFSVVIQLLRSCKESQCGFPPDPLTQALNIRNKTQTVSQAWD